MMTSTFATSILSPDAAGIFAPTSNIRVSAVRAAMVGLTIMSVSRADATKKIVQSRQACGHYGGACAFEFRQIARRRHANPEGTFFSTDHGAIRIRTVQGI